MNELLKTSKTVSQGELVSKSRWEYFFKLDSSRVPGHALAIFTKEPGWVFRPERMIVPDDVAVDFDILDIRIDDNSQLPWKLRATAFGTDQSQKTNLGRYARRAYKISVTVRNNNAEARDFRATFTGPGNE